MQNYATQAAPGDGGNHSFHAAAQNKGMPVPKQQPNWEQVEPGTNLFNQPSQNQGKAGNLFDEPVNAYAMAEPTRVSGGNGKGAQANKAGAKKANAATRVSAPAKARPAGSGGGGKKGGNGKKGRKKPSAAKYVWKNIGKAILCLFFVGVMVVSMFAVTMVRYVVEATEDDGDMLDLESKVFSQTSHHMALNPNNPNAKEENDYIVYQTVEGGESNSTWVPLTEIPELLIDAVLSTEDREFYENDYGFSFKHTVYAGLNQIFHFKSTDFGASTLDQQLVKNLTGEKQFEDESGSKLVGYERKMREIYRAYTMNYNYSKDMILEAYLNTLPLSGTIVGVKAGAREYFNKELNELTAAECALIAGITQAPTAYNPFMYPENAVARRNDVLWMMYDNGKLTKAEMEAEAAKELGLQTPDNSYLQKGSPNSYFSDAVLEQFVTDCKEQLGYDRSQALNAYYNGGLKFYLTIDINMQKAMEEQYAKGYGPQWEGYIFPDITAEVEVYDEDGVTVTGTETQYTQSCMVVFDYDGELKAIVGGIGDKETSLTLNRATQAPRHVGSTMKPLTAYALGIDYGYIDYSMMVRDSYVQGNWPRNFGGEPGGQNMSIDYAVAWSINTVAARVGSWVGEQEMFDFLRDTLQVKNLVSADEDAQVNDVNLSSMVLGGMTNGMTAYDLAAAYQIFGNGGVYNTPHLYTHVEDADGNLFLKPTITSVQAISPDTAFIMNRLLSGVLRYGTASGMATNYMDSVAKTGTSTGPNGEDLDRWFVGLTPYYVSAVWWGYDGNKNIAWGAGATTNPPPMMWKTIMEHSQAELEYKEFPAQPGTVFQRAYCKDTGMLAGPNCSSTGSGYYMSNGRFPAECPHQTGNDEEDE